METFEIIQRGKGEGSNEQVNVFQHLNIKKNVLKVRTVQDSAVSTKQLFLMRVLSESALLLAEIEILYFKGWLGGISCAISFSLKF